MNSVQIMIDNFISYIKKEHPVFSDWYIGITSSVADRLFLQHNVNKESGPWMCNNNPMTDSEVRAVEKYLLEKYGLRGGSGGGDNCCYVYIYLIKPFTKEDC